MKKYIKAKSLVDTFLDYHDDEKNYRSQKGNFDKAYEILDKYGDSDVYDVREAFLKADPDDQNEIVRLITPKAKYGEKGYSKLLYTDAKENASGDIMYNEGVVRAFESLAKEGYIDLSEFR